METRQTDKVFFKLTQWDLVWESFW